MWDVLILYESIHVPSHHYDYRLQHLCSILVNRRIRCRPRYNQCTLPSPSSSALGYSTEKKNHRHIKVVLVGREIRATLRMN